MKKRSVVIFVHGIGADQDEWWGTTKYFLKNDMDIKKYAVVDFWGYRTAKFTTPKNRLLNLFGKGTVLANDLFGFYLINRVLPYDWVGISGKKAFYPLPVLHIAIFSVVIEIEIYHFRKSFTWWYIFGLLYGAWIYPLGYLFFQCISLESCSL